MSDLPATPAKRTAIDRFLNIVEKGGNALPHPATLFAILALTVIVLSWIASQFTLMVHHPVTGAEIRPVNLLSIDGLHRILTGLVTNFTGFAPLGTVLVSLIGIGVAEHSGLIGAALRQLVLAAPRFLLTPILVFAGVMSNMASEIGYVLLVPLAGLIFQAAGRHPILGMAAAFAGVSGGYSANLLLGTIDPLLAGLSQEAARILDHDYTVSPAANYYFMFVSTFVVTALGWFVTEVIVAKRFPDAATRSSDEKIEPMSAAEKRGLVYALVASLALTALILWGTLPADGFLRDRETGDLLNSPFLQGIVAIIFAYGVVAGIAYGIGAGTVKSDEDVIKGMSQSMATLGGYLVLVFFAAQFVAFFNWTQLGLIFAVEGATFLKALNMPAIPLFMGFILLTATANLFMGSASAKWALMAPVFVPMFMLLGYSPEITQLGYRIGDSVTNIISPMMSYFALIIAFFQRYEPKAGIGTLVAVMLPYSIVFLIGWTVLFSIWLALDLPIGPGAPLEYIQAMQAG
ncbi:AbgT family transporter [Rehaibacterium terrae]|jgi:aminobenzoyl-glutamate transport protein|uniref:Aminobenzoyl-glutamate transport protein n=1 Tax=Rehaibacterium terrae TaxID=1341696 RepID=A0A7W7Y0D8_9GAMM|nr:AbgT family transporter [Rehaibacterium terrae]MBB5015788.1 aminobenzoyl-glutamate transport protein [Rehaibacterium terrae]